MYTLWCKYLQERLLIYTVAKPAIITNLVTEHDPQLVPSTYYPHNLPP